MAQDTKSKKARRRSDYGYSMEYQTRWHDNDVYHHMNNSIYSFLLDSVINAYLMEHCGLQPATGDQVGLVVHSYCDFYGSIAFPAVVDLRLRVLKLGKSSVAYEVGVFEKGHEEVRAVGGFIHVFVERETMRPSSTGMNDIMRKGLEKLLIQSRPESSKL